MFVNSKNPGFSEKERKKKTEKDPSCSQYPTLPFKKKKNGEKEKKGSEYGVKIKALENASFMH